MKNNLMVFVLLYSVYCTSPGILADEKLVNLKTNGQHFNGVLNGIIQLPCEVSDNSKVTRIWKKDSYLLFYNLNALAGPNMQVLEDGSLKIFDLKEQDSGNYVCIVQGSENKFENVTHVLTISEQPVTRTEILAKDNITTIKIGGLLSLTCKVTGPAHTPIIWVKDFTSLPVGEENLTKFPFTYEDVGIYNCTVFNANGDPVTSSITIQAEDPMNPMNPMNLGGPLEILSKSQEFTKNLGEIVVLPCDVISANPYFTRTWSKNDTLLFQNTLQVGGGTNLELLQDGSLKITNLEKEDSGSYKCLAYVTLLDFKNITHTLKVQVPSQDTNIFEYLKAKDNITNLNRGDTLLLTCKVKGYPNINLFWYKDEEALMNIDETYIKTDVTYKDAGRYRCLVYSPDGHLSERHIDIKVNDPLNELLPPHLLSNPQVITAGLGETIQLPCEVGGYPNYVRSWYINETVLFQGLDAVKADSTASLLENGTLVVSNLKKEDGGFYKCSVKTSPTKFQNVTHRVKINPPSPALIEYLNAKDNKTILKEGDMLSLTCKVNGYPPPEISWFKDSKRLLFDGENFTKPNIETKDAGVYRCLVFNGHGPPDYRNLNIVVDAKFKSSNVSNSICTKSTDPSKILQPLFMDSKPQEIIADIGESVQLPCQVSGNPNYVRSWERNGTLLFQGIARIKAGSNIELLKDGSLNISNLQKEDDGFYKCSAKTVSDNPQNVIHRIILKVHTPPKIEYLRAENNVTVLKVGDKLSLTCKVSGYPPPTIAWMKTPDVLSSNKETFTKNDVQFSDAGIYRCVAINGVNGPAAETIEIYVINDNQLLEILFNQSPVNLQTNPQVFVSDLGESVILPCNVSGNSAYERSWEKNKTILFEDDVPVKITSSMELLKNGSLKISNVQKEDEGSYTCSIESLFDDPKNVTHQIIVKTPSESPPKVVSLVSKDNKTTFQTGDTLTLICKVSGYPIPSILWIKDTEVTISKENVLVKKNIQRNDSGIYQCFITDKAGLSSHGKIEIKVDEPKEEKSLSLITKPKKFVEDLGVTIELPCEVSGDKVYSRIWKKDDLDIFLDSFPIIFESNMRLFENGSIKIFNLEKKDAGAYMCIVTDFESNEIKQENVTHKVEIKHLESDIEYLKAKDNITTLKKGDTLILTCKVKKNFNSNISWFKEHKKLETKGENFIKKDIESNDAGTYRCLAFDKKGNPKLQEINIKVEDKSDIPSKSDKSSHITSKPQDLFVDEGASVDLPCEVDGNLDFIRMWEKNGSTLFIENTPLKADLNMNTFENGSLKISNFRKEDTGIYICVVKFVSGLKEELKHKVQLSETFGPVVRLTAKNNIRTLNKGDALVLTCEATGNPKPIVKWLKDGKTLKNQGENFTKNDVDSKDGGFYWCEATNNKGSDRGVINIEVNETSTNQSTVPEEIKPQKFVANIGESVQLPCNFFNNSSNMRMWYNNGTLLFFELKRVAAHANMSILKNGSLEISNLQKKDAGAYTCEIMNPLNGTRQNVTHTLEVKVPSKFKIEYLKAKNNITTLKQGQTLTLTCKVSGSSKYTRTWLKNYKKLEFIGESFTKNDIGKEDAGTYHCLAFSDNGKSNQKTIDIQVVEKPVASSYKNKSSNLITKPQELNISEGSTVLLGCEVEGNSDFLRLWKKNGSIIFTDIFPMNDDVNINLLENGSLKITNFQKKDIGTYKCLIIPGGQEVTHTVKLGELLPSIIEYLMPKNNTTILKTGDTLSLTCKASGNPKPTLTWYKNIEKLDVEGENFTRHNVQSNDSAFYWCLAENGVGFDDRASVFIEVTDAPAANKEVHMESKPQKLVKTVGESVQLPCKISDNSQNGQIWQHDGKLLFLESVKMDAHSNIKLLENGSIEISNLQKEDNGTYRCLVKGSPNKFLNVTHTLTVNEISHPTIEYLLAKDNVTTLKGGDTLSLTCKVSGFPTPTVLWFKGSERLKFVGENLTLYNIQGNDGGLYMCIADNGIGKPDFEKIEIKVNDYSKILSSPLPDEKPLLMLSKPEHIVTNSGKTIHLPCEISGNPYYIRLWKKSETILFQGSIRLKAASNMKLLKNGSLEINNVQKEDAGSYKCVVKTASVISSYNFKDVTHTVNVIELTQSKIESFKPKDNVQRLKVGDTLSLTCKVSGFPEPTITWFKNTEKLDFEGETLVKHYIQYNDSGSYHCMAENGVGNPAYSTVHIQVDVPFPVISPSPPTEGKFFMETKPREFVTNIAKTIILPCNVISDSYYLRIWQKNEKMLFQGPQRLEAEPNIDLLEDGSLKILVLQNQDAGYYKCSVSSKTDFQNVTHRVVIQQTMYPSIEYLMAKDNITTLKTGDTLTLICKVNGYPTPKISWFKGSERLESVGETYTKHFIQPQDAGIYRCSADDGAGYSIHSAIEITVQPYNNPPSGNFERPLERPFQGPLERPFQGPMERPFQGPIERPLETPLERPFERPLLFLVTKPQEFTPSLGETIVLPCIVQSNQQYVRTWEQNGKIIFVGPTRVAAGLNMDLFEDGSLRIANVQMNNNDVYTCSVRAASNDYQEVQHKITVKAPTSLQIQYLEARDNITTLKPGDTLMLTCKVSGYPPPTITWFKNSEQLQSNSEVLVRYNTQYADAGLYRCRAENSAVFPVERSIDIRVEGSNIPASIIAPPPVITPTPDQIDPKRDEEIINDELPLLNMETKPQQFAPEYGDTIQLPCKITTNSDFVRIWEKDGKLLFQDSIRMQPNSTLEILQDGSLKIPYVREEDSGAYRCSGVISPNKSQDVTHYVKVKDAIHPVIEKLEVRDNKTSLKSGETLSLTCKANGRPKPIIFWYKDSKGLDSRGENFVKHNVQYFDSGTYRCMADNGFGVPVYSDVNIQVA